jgi:ABC-type multidrug transport system permease subunit
MLSIVTTGLPIQCDASELAIFPAPPGQTCDSYAGAFAQQSGGYVEVQPDGLCGYCQFATGDAWAASFSVYRSNLWRDFGIFWAYSEFYNGQDHSPCFFF